MYIRWLPPDPANCNPARATARWMGGGGSVCGGGGNNNQQQCFVHMAHADCRPTRWPESPRTMVKCRRRLRRRLTSRFLSDSHALPSCAALSAALSSCASRCSARECCTADNPRWLEPLRWVLVHICRMDRAAPDNQTVDQRTGLLPAACEEARVRSVRRCLSLRFRGRSAND